MRASNKPQDPAAPGFPAVEAEYGQTVRGLWCGAIGRTVRCVPTRRTVVVAVGDGWVFAKWRRGERRMAAAEWHWLHVLPMLGIRTPQPIAWIARGAHSLVVTRGLRGRALDAWAVDARAEGWWDELVVWAVTQVAPAVRALHDAGLAYRDLYWNHVFAEDPRRGEPPAFLDVERVFAPRWRTRRWVVKDLAGLLASAPRPLSPRSCLRFLRGYLGEPVSRHRGLVTAIAKKAARVRQRVPRYG